MPSNATQNGIYLKGTSIPVRLVYVTYNFSIPVTNNALKMCSVKLPLFNLLSVHYSLSYIFENLVPEENQPFYKGVALLQSVNRNLKSHV